MVWGERGTREGRGDGEWPTAGAAGGNPRPPPCRRGGSLSLCPWSAESVNFWLYKSFTDPVREAGGESPG